MLEEKSSDFPGVAWQVARSRCLSFGGELASIHSRQEQNFINTLLKEESYWIGLNDVNKVGKRSWSDNSTWSFTNWAGPEEKTSKGFCVRLLGNKLEPSKTGTWRVENCEAQRSFICKIKGNTINLM